MVIDEGVLFKTTENAYIQAKKELLEQFNLHTIISLPAGVFANAVASGTGPKTSLCSLTARSTRPGIRRHQGYLVLRSSGCRLQSHQDTASDCRQRSSDCLKKLADGSYLLVLACECVRYR
jgi:hypothetical protein